MLCKESSSLRTRTTLFRTTFHSLYKHNTFYRNLHNFSTPGKEFFYNFPSDQYKELEFQLTYNKRNSKWNVTILIIIQGLWKWFLREELFLEKNMINISKLKQKTTVPVFLVYWKTLILFTLNSTSVIIKYLVIQHIWSDSSVR